MLQFAQKTDIGRVRSHNEDAIGTFETQNGHLFILCDGMGGHKGGALAANLAIEAISDYIDHTIGQEPLELIEKAIVQANHRIYEEALLNDDCDGMGTTCVVLLIKNSEAYYAHVGDSRLYFYRNGEVQQMTKDHSVVQQLIDEGKIHPSESQRHPRKHEILRSLGQATVDVELCNSPLKLQKGDIFLSCSDGLSNHINNHTLKAILKQKSTLRNMVTQLIDISIHGGGHDNISVQLVQID